MRQRLVEAFLFQPTPGVDLRPEEIGVPAEEVRPVTRDGVRIHGFFLPREGATRAILFLHGNAGNASHRLPNAVALAGLGAHVLLLEYRGYGAAEGRASVEGLALDAEAGLAHLVEGRRIPEERLVLFGRSLGGAVAAGLARGRGLAGVVLESTFPSLRAVAEHHVGPAARLADADALHAERALASLRAPLLVLHGDRDEIVPYALGRRLFEAAPEPKELETIRGAGHNDTVEVGGAAYLERLRRFLDAVAPEG